MTPMRASRPVVLLGVAWLLAAADDKPPAALEPIYQGQATGIMGSSVDGPANEPVGIIVDVLVDDQGQPRAVVIDFGGFMGVGKRRIAVAWRALHFLPAAQQHRVRIDLTLDQIKATPDFNAGARPVDPPIKMAAPPPGPAAADQ